MREQRTFGIILIIVGALLLVAKLTPVSLAFGLWDALLALGGISLIVEAFTKRRSRWFQLSLGIYLGSVGLFNMIQPLNLVNFTGSDLWSIGWPILLIGLGLDEFFSKRYRVWSTDPNEK